MTGRMADTYTHGHHESVVKSHSERSAEDSAAFLLPHLTAEMHLLDVGCGPATITCDLATHVAEVIGIEPPGSVLDTARENAKSRGVANVSFCLLYTSPSPRDQRGSRMPSSA